MADISKITLPDSSEYNIKDAGALRIDATAVGASNLRYSYRIDGTNGVWFQFMQFTLSDNETTKFFLFFTDGGNAYQGLLNCRFHHTSGGSINATVRWWAKNGYSVDDIRYTVDQTTETITLYIHKRSPSFILFYNILSSDHTAYKNISSYFTTLQVSEPTTATSAGGVVADRDGNGDQIDTTYLKKTETANQARQLSAEHYFTVTEGQWYKIFEIQMTTSTARHLLLTINNTGSRYCGIVYCYFNRHSTGVASSTRVRWLAIEGFSTSDLRVTDATENGVTTFSLYLRARATQYIYISTIRTMSRTSTVDVSEYWLSEAVSAPPDTAINAIGPVAIYDGDGNSITSTYLKTANATAAAVGALAKNGNVYDHALATTGWYKVFEFTSEDINRSYAMTMLIENGYNSDRFGVLSFYLNHSSAGNLSGSARWLSTTFPLTEFRYTVDNTTKKFTLYAYQSQGYLYFRGLAADSRNPGNTYFDNPSLYWKSEAVNEPASATLVYPPIGYGLRYSSVTVSAGTNQQIISITDAKINAGFTLARIEWANPDYITDGYTWTTGAGSFTLSGTATAATTANILLIRSN